MKIKAIALLFCTLPLAGCLEPPPQKAPPPAVVTVAPAKVKVAPTTPKPIVIPTSGGDGSGGGWGG